ncbi:hypothetical protein [Asticcacaulis sp. W401b]|uniref:hypothetical protein n=1 Tax=Asticcacaulis sp. W401b TaxID=3388666 RepID=UPI003971088B
MRKVAIVGLMALGLTACGQKPAEPQPSEAAKLTFTGCEWQAVRGRQLSMYAFACPNTHMVADETLPGFGVVESGPDDVSYYRPVLRAFPKPPQAAIESVLPQIRKLTPQAATCVLTPAQDPTAEKTTRALFELTPTGEALKAWEQTVRTGEGEALPCGPLGVGMAGSRVFEVLPEDPAYVVYIDYGSEIQIFDTTTLRRVKSDQPK